MVLLSESAKSLGIPYTTVYNAWRAGRIAYERHGNWIFVRQEDVEKAMAGYRKRELVMPKVRESA
jgi:excisionase family DNA binding protein